MAQTSTSRKSERKEKVRAEILEAASRLFAAQGYETVTLRAVAEEIGYSHGALYQHFPDKSHILAEICRETFALLVGDFDRIAGQAISSKERLFQTSRGLVHFCLAHPQHCRIVFFGPENRNGIRAGEYINEIGRPLFERFERVFLDCVQSGDVQTSQGRLAGQTWWCSVLGLAMVMIIQGKLVDFSEPELVIEHAISTMWAGLRSTSHAEEY